MEKMEEVIPDTLREVAREGCRCKSSDRRGQSRPGRVSQHGASTTSALIVRLPSERPEIGDDGTVLYHIRMRRRVDER